MFCSTLLGLENQISIEDIMKVDAFFQQLRPEERAIITLSRMRNVWNFSEETMQTIIKFCLDTKILSSKYILVCDNCDLMIKQYEDISTIPFGEREYCYNCDTYVDISKHNLILTYEVSDLLYPFDERQHEMCTTRNATSVVYEEADKVANFSNNEINVYVNSQIYNNEGSEKKRNSNDQKKNRIKYSIVMITAILVCIGIFIVIQICEKEGNGIIESDILILGIETILTLIVSEIAKSKWPLS